MRVRVLPEGSEHGWTPYVWLVYASLYVAYPLGTHPSAIAWLEHAAGLCAFLALYLRSYWVDGARRLPFIVGIVALGVVFTPLNPGATSFFVYAAAFVGGARTGAAAARWITAIAVVGGIVGWLAGWGPSMQAFVLVFVPLIGFVNVHYAEVRRRDAALRLAQDEIARLAALGERERIARDLHDLLGHTLSVIVLKAELASKLLERDRDRAAAEVADVERISREALAEVRRAVLGFHTASFDDELVRARSVLQTAAVQLESTADVAVLASTTPQASGALAFALREAITNVVRHANATRCRVALGHVDGAVRLEIEDDGVGGDAAEGSGLQGMRARMREVGGTLERDGRRGTLVRATVPVKEPADGGRPVKTRLTPDGRR